MYLLQVIIYICIYYRSLYIYVSTTGHYIFMYLLQVIIYIYVSTTGYYIYMYLLQVIILYVIQLSDRVYNVTFPAYDLYSLRCSRREYRA